MQMTKAGLMPEGKKPPGRVRNDKQVDPPPCR